MVTTVEFDHAEASAAEFLAFGEQLRSATAPVYNEAHGGFWVASRFSDIQAIVQDPKRFLSGKGITIPPLGQPVPVVPAESDEPGHKHYRGVLAPFLTPRAVRQNEPVVRQLVTEMIDDFIEAGEVDVVPHFAIPIPVYAMATIFGLTRPEAKQFFDAFTSVLEAAASGVPAKAQRAGGEFAGYIVNALNEMRSKPADMTNIYSAIVHTERNGQPFSDNECIGLLWSTTAAATETTTHAIGHAVRQLGTRPEVRRALIEDPSLIPAAVEEILRLDAPNYTIARYVAEDVTVGGVTMKAGERVLLLYGVANKDEAVFPKPEDFDLGRGMSSHLSFGMGLHNCVGKHLARQEVQLAVEELLKRIPDFELLGDPGLPRLRGGLMWGHDQLRIRFTPGTRQTG
jgi:cytochrome P450